MDASSASRREWLRVLAMEDPSRLSAEWDRWLLKPEVEAVRGPETGLVMVRGRIGAGGDRFNMGEATVSRATLRLRHPALAAELVGEAHVLGSDTRHAWLAAVFDGLLSDDGQRADVLRTVVEPLRAEQEQRDARRRGEASGTRVDFFTMARETS